MQPTKGSFPEPVNHIGHRTYHQRCVPLASHLYNNSSLITQIVVLASAFNRHRPYSHTIYAAPLLRNVKLYRHPHGPVFSQLYAPAPAAPAHACMPTREDLASLPVLPCPGKFSCVSGAPVRFCISLVSFLLDIAGARIRLLPASQSLTNRRKTVSSATTSTIGRDKLHTFRANFTCSFSHVEMKHIVPTLKSRKYTVHTPLPVGSTVSFVRRIPYHKRTQTSILAESWRRHVHHVGLPS